MTPTARALAYCRKQGWLAEVVERRLPHCFITHDLFNAFDIVALDHDSGCLGVQVTSTSNTAARVAKLTGNPAVRTWLAKGLRAEVWGFAKRGPRGKAKRWTLRRQQIVLEGGEMVAKECA